jgi:hypothetical protein
LAVVPLRVAEYRCVPAGMAVLSPRLISWMVGPTKRSAIVGPKPGPVLRCTVTRCLWATKKTLMALAVDAFACVVAGSKVVEVAPRATGARWSGIAHPAVTAMRAAMRRANRAILVMVAEWAEI